MCINQHINQSGRQLLDNIMLGAQVLFCCNRESDSFDSITAITHAPAELFTLPHQFLQDS
jgi:hypothetical protein